MVWNPNTPSTGAGLTSQPIRDNFEELELLTYGGRGRFNTTTGYQVTFANYGLSDLPDTKYHVSVTPLGMNDNIGTVYVGSRTITGFIVYNSGTDAQIPFTWSLGYRST